MRILVIEDDEHLYQFVEKFIDALAKDGYEITIVTDCYNKVSELTEILDKDNPGKPDIIAFFSTFTYQ